MLVDWFTTAAQMINFLILVWLLKRFLYKPILQAMDEREKRMMTALKEAEEQNQKAEEARLTFQKKTEELEQGKERILRQAANDAAEQRKKMIVTARQEVAEMETRWREAIEHEKESMAREVATGIQKEVFETARQVLADLAGADIESRIVERFIERLQSVPRIAPWAEEPPSVVVIASAFDLSTSIKERLEGAVRQKVGPRTAMQFVTEPEVIGGIELNANGYKLSWTIRSYLASLNEDMGRFPQNAELQHVHAAS